MKAIELYNALCEQIPASLSCEWDHDGLESCPTPEKEVKRVLVALDVTDEVIDKAVDEKFDVIASHHPIFFGQLENVNATCIKGARAVRLAKNDISVMSFHTRLDALEGGVNDTLARKMGLENIEIVEADSDGIMRIGELSKECPAEQFAARVKAALSTGESEATVILSPSGKCVRRVALIGGGGGKFIGIAKEAGADTYVTGDMGYHDYLSAAEREMNLITAGHFHTEFPVCAVLGDKIKAICPDADVEIFCSDRMKTF
ncbi:MAG: Nif3-like dinuclear metal center hexameric protein [Ruminococcaceae bacterium]|nr:Nif3-like dinuclear metal center hexameric protein [Oscillospiraceae bacterium]